MKNFVKLSFIPIVVLTIMILLWNCKDETDDKNNEWETIFFDDFNREDGGLGKNYSVQIYGNGTATISDNQLKIEDGKFYAVRYETKVPDNKVKFSLKCTTDDQPSTEYAFGISVRTKNLANEWMEQEVYMGAIWMYSDSISISKLVGTGIPISLVEKKYDSQPNKSYLLELTYDSGDLKLVITDLSTNKTETLNVTDPSPLSGDIISINGMQADGDVIYFDDFKIEIMK